MDGSGAESRVSRIRPGWAALLSAALFLGALLRAGPAPAQPDAARAPDPAQVPAPTADPARLEDGPVPAEPAPAPPRPADLTGRAPAAAPPPALGPGRPSPLPAGIEILADGLLRLRFAAGSEAPPRSTAPALAELGRRLSAMPEGRVTLLAQASGPADVSTARRLSLARALAVKEALVAGGLAPTRVDVRPLGRTEAAMDAVDVQPPGLRRPAP